ncbi:unnamed protein product [Blepharisma stoltei]|uniref:CFA20 domain-containing protein n=1 Tax=Blepharisma stoltei TaxID=1481888 RepID=A0AAU9IUX9_9CILI|nr:unnamed protein product [Blepharisma stoltei]
MKNDEVFNEIFDSHNKSLLKFCLIHGKSEYGYKEEYKENILTINQGTFLIPRNNREFLQSTHKLLNLQLFIFKHKLFLLEITVSDSQSTIRKLIFTHSRIVIKNPLQAKLPHSIIERGLWQDLFLDIESLYNLCFPNSTLQYIQMISITGTFMLRKIMSTYDKSIPIPDQHHFSDLFTFKPLMITSLTYPHTSKQNLFVEISPSRILEKHKLNSPNMLQKRSLIEMEISQLKVAHMKGINLGTKIFFRKNKAKADIEDNRKKNRKITHNYTRESDIEEEIEENIEVDMPEENRPFIGIINSESCTAKEFFKPPDWFSEKLSSVMKIRHFTPPFVNIKDLQGQQLIYNPASRFYDQEW